MKTFEGTALEGKHPMDMIGRLALLDKLRQVGPDMLNRLLPEVVNNFLTEKITPDSYNVSCIDWEYALFKATDKELEDLMSNFIAKVKPNDVQSKLIIAKK